MNTELKSYMLKNSFFCEVLNIVMQNMFMNLNLCTFFGENI